MASRTRNAIMDSCVQLLQERPISKISVKDVVEECGINRNTFYYHFQDLPTPVSYAHLDVYKRQPSVSMDGMERNRSHMTSKWLSISRPPRMT